MCSLFYTVISTGISFASSNTVSLFSRTLDWLQSLKQFFINVSYHILVATVNLVLVRTVKIIIFRCVRTNKNYFPEKLDCTN